MKMLKYLHVAIREHSSPSFPRHPHHVGHYDRELGRAGHGGDWQWLSREYHRTDRKQRHQLTHRQFRYSRGATGSTLTMADAETLMNTERFGQIEQVAPLYQSKATLTFGASEGSYTVVGTTDAYITVRNQDLDQGEFLTTEQIAANSNVVVLGATVASDLFGGQDPLAQNVRIDDALFQVIGVLASTGSSGFGSSDSQVFVPIAVAQGRLFNAAGAIAATASSAA